MTEQTQGKGRPTPKRSQKARGPVQTPPTNRREAAKQLRAKQAQARASVRDGYKAGDERVFLARDRGPVRSYVRDAVDSQRSLGPVLLPYMVVVIVVGFLNDPGLYFAAFMGMIGLMVIVGMDFLRLGRLIRKGVRERFPDEKKLRGHVLYGLQRTTLIRKWRNPPVKVQVGDSV